MNKKIKGNKKKNIKLLGLFKKNKNKINYEQKNNMAF